MALPGLPGVLGVLVELAEPVAPVADEELDAAEPGVLLASAPGAGEGVGVAGGVGEAVGAVGAGGGVTTFVSSFLPQAVRPTATRAARRSERFMVFSFRRTSTVLMTSSETTWAPLERIPRRHAHFSSRARGLLLRNRERQRPSTPVAAAACDASQSSP